VQLSPEFDDKGIAADPSRVNDFNFDSPGSANVDFRCPMAAHIRKTNPRNDLSSRGPNGIVSRFRILRRGIPYVRSAQTKLQSFQIEADTDKLRATNSTPTPTAPAVCSSSVIKAPSAMVSLSSRASGPTRGILSSKAWV
jgi:hypothetical protein